MSAENNPPKMSFPEFKAVMEEYERGKRKNTPPNRTERLSAEPQLYAQARNSDVKEVAERR